MNSFLLIWAELACCNTLLHIVNPTEEDGDCSFVNEWMNKWLIDWLQADADVEQFISEENHSFDEYCKEVLKYQKLVDEISYNSEKVGSRGGNPA